jgi:hypothetical protein
MQHILFSLIARYGLEHEPRVTIGFSQKRELFVALTNYNIWFREPSEQASLSGPDAFDVFQVFCGQTMGFDTTELPTSIETAECLTSESSSLPSVARLANSEAVCSRLIRGVRCLQLGAKSMRGSTTLQGSPAKQMAAFVDKFDPQIGKVIRACRARLRKLLPTAVELVYDNYNFFVIGFASTERASDTIVSLAAASNGVGLSFYHGATLPDPKMLLLGTGKQNRFIRLPDTRPLQSPDVLELIRAAVTQAKTPLRRGSRGYTVIKSVAAKQRPRRKTKAAPNNAFKGRRAKRARP